MIRGKAVPVVSVSVYRKDDKSDLQISVNPEHLNMKNYRKGAHVIKWALDTVGFEFSSDPKLPAIEFTSENWQRSFGDLKLHAGNRTATLVNKNSDGLAFSYNVHVVEKKTGHKAFLDPVIQNNQN